jgi:peroxiredoxin
MRYIWLLLVSALSLLARDFVVTKAGDAEMPVIHLQNNSDATVTAWVVGCSGITAPGQWTSQYRWSDSLMSPEGKTLDPGKETEYRIPKRPAMMNQSQPDSSSKCEGFRPFAVVFADGTVFGDLTWIHAIVAERQQLHKDLGKVIDILNKNIADNGNAEAAVKQLNDWMEAQAIRNHPGRPSPSYGESSGWSTQSVSPSRAPRPAVVQARPFARAAAPGAAIWLIQEKKNELPEAVKTLTAWRDQLGKWDAVTGPAVQGPASGPLPMMSSGNPPQGPQPDLIGKPAPDFILRDVNGKEVALKDLRGKTVFLDFWATWCEPCRRGMPDVKAMYDSFHDKGLEVVAIDHTETADVARKYFEEQKYPYLNLLDPRHQAFNSYGGGGIPKVVLIDKDGIVRFYQQGYHTGEDFAAQVRKLGL